MSTVVDISNASHRDGPIPQSHHATQGAPAIRRILACVDDSTFSHACLQSAVAIARSLDAAITLLYVMQPARVRSEAPTTDVLDWEIARQQASAYLEGLEKEGTRELGRRIDTRLEQGRPEERITAVARQLDVDLTILGRQGEHGIAEWGLGSTVQHVLAVSRGSVLIARTVATSPGAPAPKRILVPLDGSLRAESVLPTVLRIATAHHAEVLLAFVVREPVATVVLSAPEDLDAARDLARRIEASARGYLEGLRARLTREGATVRTLVARDADERRSLIAACANDHSDLIVVSAHGSTCNPDLMCGSVTAHLLMHSPVSLLVLQDLGRAARGTQWQTAEESAPPLRGHYVERG